ncbi:Serine/threonine protein kinase [Fusarium oxysporum f. sp. albedinis]|nr:Serine/threonine protein kinase [Fusarium oxysporum f. sp. albedinis]
MSSGEDILLNELSLIGFDHAFEISSLKTIEPLTEFLVPEVAVGKPASPASDVWALGVTILNILKYFGELPTSWEEPFYDEEGRPTSDKTTGRTRDVCDKIHSLKQWIRDIWDESTQSNENEPYPKHYANRGWKPSATKINGTYLSEGGGLGWFAYLPGNSGDAEMLYNLLREIFVYEERINAEDILGYTWFGIV